MSPNMNMIVFKDFDYFFVRFYAFQLRLLLLFNGNLVYLLQRFAVNFRSVLTIDNKTVSLHFGITKLL